MTRISVIMAAYNYARFIAEAVQSVLRQEPAVHELIVVDDGSTDDTPDVLARIEHPLLKVVRKRNAGVSAARNTALDMVTGDVVSFLDADDRWLPGKIATEFRLLEAEPDVLSIVWNFRRFDANRTFDETQFTYYPELRSLALDPVAGMDAGVLRSDCFIDLVDFAEIPTWPSAMTIRTRALDDIRFSPALKIGEDMHFGLRAFRKGPVAFVNEPFVELRRHGANATADFGTRSSSKLAPLHMLEQEPLEAHQHAALRRRIARAHVLYARELATQRSIGAFLNQTRHAARYRARPAAMLKNFALLAAALVRPRRDQR